MGVVVGEWCWAPVSRELVADHGEEVVEVLIGVASSADMGGMQGLRCSVGVEEGVRGLRLSGGIEGVDVGTVVVGVGRESGVVIAVIRGGVCAVGCFLKLGRLALDLHLGLPACLLFRFCCFCEGCGGAVVLLVSPLRSSRSVCFQLDWGCRTTWV